MVDALVVLSTVGPKRYWVMRMFNRNDAFFCCCCSVWKGTISWRTLCRIPICTGRTWHRLHRLTERGKMSEGIEVGGDLSDRTPTLYTGGWKRKSFLFCRRCRNFLESEILFHFVTTLEWRPRKKNQVVIFVRGNACGGRGSVRDWKTKSFIIDGFLQLGRYTESSAWRQQNLK